VTPPASSARRLRVVLVDADHRVRDSLASLLVLGDEIEVVGRAGEATAAISLCADLAPDVIVVDPRLPDVEGGLALLAEVRSRFPDTIVLVLSWPGTATEEAAATVGADGVISKSAAPGDLIDSIVALSASETARRAGRSAPAPAA
jgi:DNA-binding NarL/FixJ family response regulator